MQRLDEQGFEKFFADPPAALVVLKGLRTLAEREVLSSRDLVGGIRRRTRAMQLTPERGSPYLLGGVDVTLECAGGGLDTALRVTRAGGRVIGAGQGAGARVYPAPGVTR